MAEATPAARRPSRPLAILLLVVQVVLTATLMVSGFWAFFHEDRGTGMWHLSLGILAFLFFGWAARLVMRPRPA